MNGIKKWNRSTEPLKNNVFSISNRGYTNRDIASESGISVASVERFFHQMVGLKVKHRSNRLCPRFLGIDEHRFTKRVGFATTFCNLEKHSVFDIATGRSEAELLPFLQSLKGRERVKVVCMDMYSPYRKMVKKWFPNAKIVTDRFHVIKLINHHFAKTCKILDEDNLAWGRGGLIRAMSTKPPNLSSGAVGFEPTASCSQGRRANQAALRPDTSNEQPDLLNRAGIFWLPGTDSNRRQGG